MLGREGGCVMAVKGGGSGSASRRSWIVMDSSGEEIVVDVDKYAIMHRVQIHARDLRILDPLLSYPSTILGRDRAIVLNLEHIKAIITAQEVLLLDHDSVVPIVEDLRRRLKPRREEESEDADADADADESPFEFRALEAALEAICSYLSARTTEVEAAVYPALDRLTSKISGPHLDCVRKLKTQMTRLTARVHKVREELEHLLDDDDDMAHLYLSRKLANTGGDGVEEIEMLLEAYFVEIDGTQNRLSSLREYVDSTQDYMNIQIDSRRNKLIQLEVWLNAATVCLAIYSLVAGIFGMNIPYTWNEDHGYVFKWVVIDTAIFCALLFILIMSYARYKGLVGSYFYAGSGS